MALRRRPRAQRRAVPACRRTTRHDTTTRQARIPFQNRRHPRARTSDFGGSAAILGNRRKLVAPKEGGLELDGIIADPGEAADLAPSDPETVKAMDAQLREWQRSVEVSLTGADYK